MADNEGFLENDKKIARCIGELEENLSTENNDEIRQYRHWRAKSPRNLLKTIANVRGGFTDRSGSENHRRNSPPPPIPKSSPPPLETHTRQKLHIYENSETFGNFMDATSYDTAKGQMNEKVREEEEMPMNLGNSQRRRFTSRISENSSKRRFQKFDENGFQMKHEKSSDEESNSGSLGSFNYFDNSIALEQAINDNQRFGEKQRRSGVQTATPYHESQESREIALAHENGNFSSSFIGERVSSHSLPRHYSKNIYRSNSLEDDRTINFSNYSKEMNSAAKRESFANSRSRNSTTFNEVHRSDPSFIPPIVTAIDSARESEIIRQCFPRRTSSRTKKINSRKGFDVVIRSQNDDDGIRRIQEPGGEKTVESCFVTEF